MSEAAPALGFSIIANVGDNRQITCQCFVGIEEETPAIHARIDKVQAVIDRQRARYEIKDLLKEREKHAVTLARAEDDFKRVEQTFKDQQDAHDRRLMDIAAQIAEIDETASIRGRVSGPQGADKSRKNALIAERKDIAALKEQQRAERDQHHTNVVISIERFKEALADCDAKIAECRDLIGGD